MDGDGAKSIAPYNDSGFGSCETSPEHFGASSENNNTSLPSKEPGAWQGAYLGCVQLDKLYTQEMLPWVIAELKSTGYKADAQICLHGRFISVLATSTDREVMNYSVDAVSRFVRLNRDAKSFALLTKLSQESSFMCHLFKLNSEIEVSQLFDALRFACHHDEFNSSLTDNATEQCDVIEADKLFEVLYIGKLLLQDRTGSVSFVDDAVAEFQNYKSTSAQRMRAHSDSSPISGESGSWLHSQYSPDTGLSYDLPSNRLAKSGNRTMLIQVRSSELRLVSLDNRRTILVQNLKHISFCSQGVKQPSFFGFIASDGTDRKYVGYIFRCSSSSVVDEILQTLRNSFTAAFNQKNVANSPTCSACPMQQFHGLCKEVDGLQPVAQLSVVKDHVELLSESDKSDVIRHYEENSFESSHEECVFLMMKLRGVCETRQRSHVHLSQRDSSRDICLCKSEQKQLKNGLSTSFENIKKKLLFFQKSRPKTETTSSPYSRLYSLCRRRTFSMGAADMSPISVTSSPDSKGLLTPPSSVSPPIRRAISRESGLSPRVPDLFVGSPQRRLSDDSAFGSPQLLVNGSLYEPMGSVQQCPAVSKRRPSVRLDIYNRVASPKRRFPSTIDDSLSESTSSQQSSGKTPAQLRSLWKKAIHETILLKRMERENRALTDRQDQAALRRCRLDYEEVTPCLRDVTRDWEHLLEAAGEVFSRDELSRCVRRGVPRARRGEVWKFLAEQSRLRHQAESGGQGHEEDRSEFGSEGDDTYESLLKQLTSHQHAILIDLGRTFPAHPYFTTALGPGQLALFNVLKAYSLYDPDVGYCQGLSFVVGVLLMHMDEEDAFTVLCQLMTTLDFRRHYMPDMDRLQMHMYQLSRLLHDDCKPVFEHLDANDIAPTLYAAPWFLTLFASQFPLGFVARVFDLVFIYGAEVLMKLSLVLLGNHKELILHAVGFEQIMEFLKTTLPEMLLVQMERTIEQVFELDLTKKLEAYEIEYRMIKEEDWQHDRNSDTLQHAEQQNESLRRHNIELLERLHQSHQQVQTLEASNDKLRQQVRALELERQALLNALSLNRGHELSSPSQSTYFQDQFPTSKNQGQMRHRDWVTPAIPPVPFTPVKVTPEIPRRRIRATSSSKEYDSDLDEISDDESRKAFT